jgi:hypothetical protein
MPPVNVDNDFSGDELDPRWSRTCVGGGQVETVNARLRFELPGATAGTYSNAQIDDYSGLAASRLLWRPPLRFETRARFSHAIHPSSAHDSGATLRGTAGFGFWNYSLSLTSAFLRLPNVIWFLSASQPSNMALAPGIPGWGWKAQVMHAHRLGAVAAIGPTALSALWGRLSGREAAAAHWVQRLTGAREALLAGDPREWATYEIEWLPERATFRVNGATVLDVAKPPAGPLGFVAWVDNQYAVATPRGEWRFGTIASERQWLELEYIRIQPFGA